jgi:hypothetical protein
MEKYRDKFHLTIICECRVPVQKYSLETHLRSRNHISRLEKLKGNECCKIPFELQANSLAITVK